MEYIFIEIDNSTKEIIASTGYNVLHVIDSLERVLNEKNLYQRTIERLKKKQMDSVEIVTYNKKFKEEFKSLNYEWLEKYFVVEAEDMNILNYPEEEIINPGGEIFFARFDGKIVGTCSAIKINNETYELAKMAVTPKVQGRQIGKKLALAVIGFVHSKGAKTVILETNEKLTAALNLYEKLGFGYVPGKIESKYQRATIKMKLEFL